MLARHVARRHEWGAFYAADAYLLPWHQENFGIAVAEALGCALEVLVSDKVNIWHEVDEANVGFVDRDTVEGCEQTLRKWLTLSATEQSSMRRRAAALFAGRFTDEAMSSSLIEVVSAARSQVPRPEQALIEP